ncbi:MAG: hypothetical protein LBD41_06720 [Clostridiales Family XIII bacterium]|jgi:hypothetical protein|nr:hypothetical protein [Clostridiales Family XIII bacterium]
MLTLRNILELIGILIKKRKTPQNVQIGKMSNLKPIKKELRMDTIDKSKKNALEDNSKATLKTKNSKKKIKKYTPVSFSLKNFLFGSRNFYIPFKNLFSPLNISLYTIWSIF